jgi:agmatine/peptidylarginine deiminase
MLNNEKHPFFVFTLKFTTWGPNLTFQVVTDNQVNRQMAQYIIYEELKMPLIFINKYFYLEQTLKSGYQVL